MNAARFGNRPATVRELAVRRIIDGGIYLFMPLLLSQVAVRRNLPMLPVLVAIVALGAIATTVKWRYFRRVAVRPLALMCIIILLVAWQAYSGSARLWDFRTSIFATVSGIICLMTMALRRPLAYRICGSLLSRGPGGRERFEARWQEPAFRHALRVMTVVWAGAAFGRAVIPLFFDARALSFDMAIVTHGLTILFTLCVVAWSVWYARRHLVESDIAKPTPAQS